MIFFIGATPVALLLFQLRRGALSNHIPRFWHFLPIISYGLGVFYSCYTFPYHLYTFDVPYPKYDPPRVHGCVLAKVITPGYLPQLHRQGIFREPLREYDAYLRFSGTTGGINAHDTNILLHSLEMKIMGIEGERNLEFNPYFEQNTQDFVFYNSEVSFTDFPAHLPFLLKAARNLDVLPFQPFEYILTKIYEYLQSPKELLSNPLHAKYYTITPYLLGNTTVKYGIRPCHNQKDNSKQGDSVREIEPIVFPLNLFAAGADFQSLHMDRSLKNGNVCFDFLFQVQNNPRSENIEDLFNSWDTPWGKIATILIKKQTFLKSDQIEFCQKLSFNPWNGLKEHYPVGSANLFQKKKLLSSIKTKSTEPTGQEWSQFNGSIVLPYEGNGNTVDYQVKSTV